MGRAEESGAVVHPAISQMNTREFRLMDDNQSFAVLCNHRESDDARLILHRLHDEQLDVLHVNENLGRPLRLHSQPRQINGAIGKVEDFAGDVLDNRG